MKKTKDEETNEFGLPGIGVPAEVLLHPFLSPTEKLLFGIIQNLSHTHRGCWATNQYLGRMLGVGKSTISNGVSNLNEYGFIEMELFDQPNGRTGRRIFIFNGYTQIYRKMIEKAYEILQRGIRKNSEGYLKKFVPPSEKITNYKSKYNNIDRNIEDVTPASGFFGHVHSSKDLITPSHFNQFWELYPRKVSKGAAKTKWESLCRKKDRPTFQKIKNAVLAQTESEQWQEDTKFIPYPATWLNQQRWLDDPEKMKSHSKSKSSNNPKTAYRRKDGHKYKTDIEI